MAAGWQGRWTCSWFVWLLGVGLMATSAVAGTEGGEFVVAAEFVKLSRAPHHDAIDPAAIMLFRGDACETSEPNRKTPWWSCRLHGQTLDMTAKSRWRGLAARLPLLEAERGGGFDAPCTGGLGSRSVASSASR